MVGIENFVYPNDACQGSALKRQPDKTWMEYAKKIAEELGSDDESKISSEEAAEFLWESIRSALDMIGSKTYEEYIFETALRGLPKWAQIDQSTWNKLNEDIVFSLFSKS